LHLHPSSGSLDIEIDEELGMLTTRPPHGYSPRLLSELGTAELFVLSSLRLCEAALLEWCPPAAARLAIEAAQALAGALRSHRIIIPIREQEPVHARPTTIPISTGQR
jgi:hypothetical protein